MLFSALDLSTRSDLCVLTQDELLEEIGYTYGSLSMI